MARQVVGQGLVIRQQRPEIDAARDQVADGEAPQRRRPVQRQGGRDGREAVA
jgi:hypothetical protein